MGLKTNLINKTYMKLAFYEIKMTIVVETTLIKLHLAKL